jgi:hypothetical protein
MELLHRRCCGLDVHPELAQSRRSKAADQCPLIGGEADITNWKCQVCL